MKKALLSKTILTLMLLLAAFNAQSQWINSITHFPVNPTDVDTVYFYADISFPSGNCDEHTQFSGVMNQDVFAGALHCLGMLTFICDYTDTFKIDPLPAGNYNFTLQVDYGGLPSPCLITGNGATDSLNFTVSSTSSIAQAASAIQSLAIFPNPANNAIRLQINNELVSSKNKSLVIYSVEGKEISRHWLGNNELDKEIDISYLYNGIYLCNLVTENSINAMVKLIVIK